ncbi:MAG: disulfide bond formation protein DsbA [Myxococcales bacterium]|nr:disulfide bond formation protein DsbA [Myxococcales bacterium]
MEAIRVTHFSDVLCIWAYVAQSRVDELRSSLGNTVAIDVRFCSVFGDARDKLAKRWADRGGFSGYGAHVRDVTDGYPHVSVHPDIWRKLQPASSLACHLFLCAVRRLAADGKLEGGEEQFNRVCWTLREAFFRDLRNISTRRVQLEIAEELRIPSEPLLAYLDDGVAHAELAGDYDLAREHNVTVSPTLILNDGRQRLNGNVSFRVIEANVRELLLQKESEQASAC